MPERSAVPLIRADVLTVEVEDRPVGLSAIAVPSASAGVGVAHVRSFADKSRGRVLMIHRVGEIGGATDLLRERDIRPSSDERAHSHRALRGSEGGGAIGLIGPLASRFEPLTKKGGVGLLLIVA